MVENSAITSTITTRATVLADIDTSYWTVDRGCLGRGSIPTPFAVIDTSCWTDDETWLAATVITARAIIPADIDTSCWTVDRDCLGNNNIPARTTSC